MAVTVLFCLLQILLWIDLNKSRRTAEPHLVTVEPRSMFREILVDTADPMVLLLMGPFLKLTRSVREGYRQAHWLQCITLTIEMDQLPWRKEKQRQTSQRLSSSTPALWVRLTTDYTAL